MCLECGRGFSKEAEGSWYRTMVILLFASHKVLTDNLPALEMVCGGLLLSTKAWKYYTYPLSALCFANVNSCAYACA